MRQLILGITTFLVAYSLNGQVDKAISVNIGVGMRNIPVEEFKSFYDLAPGLNSNMLEIGGGAFAGFGNIIVGIQGRGFSGRERVTDQHVYSAHGGSMLLSAGYTVARGNNFQLIPMASAGIAMVSYHIDSKFSIDLFEPVFVPLNSGSFNWSNYVFDLGIRLQKTFGNGQDVRFFTQAGVEAGYFFTPSSDRWTTRSEAYIFNAPEYRFNGWYLTLIFGGLSKI